MRKRILSVMAGVLAGFITVSIGDAITQKLYPANGINYQDKETLKIFITQLPTTCFAIMLCFWCISSFIGGLVAGRVNPASWMHSSILTGLVLLAASVGNMVMIPYHPIWMMVSCIILYIPLAFLGGKLTKK
jgi:hypothetical protein